MAGEIRPRHHNRHSLDLPLLVSDNFADAYGGTLKSLGRHPLRGLDRPHELFAPLVA